MTKTLIKIIINKHSKYFACLAQSVEHSAVNRSVGGPSPSTGAKKNVKTFFFFVPVFGLYPCRTVVRRHFVPRHFFRTGRLTLQINLPSALLHGGPFFLYKSQMDVKAFFFLCLFLACTPAAHLCGGTLCHDTSSRGPRKRIAFVGCGRLTLQINLPSALLHGVHVPNRIKKLRCGARRAIDDPNMLI